MSEASGALQHRANQLVRWVAQVPRYFLGLVYQNLILQAVVAGLVSGAVAMLSMKNCLVGASLTPIATAIVIGLFLKAPSPRKPRLWPPSRLWQRIEHCFESIAPDSPRLRLASPFISEAFSGAAHGVVIAAFTFLRDGDYWWYTFGAATLVWTFGVGGFRSQRRAQKLHNSQAQSSLIS